MAEIIQFVSPHITFEQWRSGAKTDIDVFEDQLRVFLFEQARAIAPNRDSGPAILALISPFFEVMACYLKGESSRYQETRFLQHGLEAVFPSVDPAAREKYIIEVRNGFAHEAMFRNILIHRTVEQYPSFGLFNGVLHLDPWWILDNAEGYFDNFVRRVRTNESGILENFKKFMLIRMGGKSLSLPER
jgi:hypothetical protein